jgi:20S proteasome alpha/beta subunit
MTAIVGIVCQDGIVIGTDSASTSATGPGQKTIETPSKKITIVDDRIIVAGTGSIGLGQRFCHLVEKFSEAKKFSNQSNRVDITTSLAGEAIRQFNQTFIQKGQIQYGALVAFPLGQTFHLCEFAALTMEPEFRSGNLWFASMGSGQPITDPFLGFLRKIFWPNPDTPPRIKEGTFFVTWALLQAIELNPGGINGPIQLAALKHEKKGPVARMLEESEIEEHKASVVAAEDRLREHIKALQGEDTGAVPPIPTIPGKHN